MSQETPRTKEATFVLNTAVDVVWPENMEQLERELNECQKEQDEAVKQTKLDSISFEAIRKHCDQLRQDLAEANRKLGGIRGAGQRYSTIGLVASSLHKSSYVFYGGLRTIL